MSFDPGTFNLSASPPVSATSGQVSNPSNIAAGGVFNYTAPASPYSGPVGFTVARADGTICTDQIQITCPSMAMSIKKYVANANLSGTGLLYADAQVTNSGPIVYAGEPVFYKYVITNSGNTPLASVSLRDTLGTNAGHSTPLTDFSCTASAGITLQPLSTQLINNQAVTLASTLPASGTITCLAKGVNGVTSGDVVNTAYVTSSTGGMAQQSDPAHYDSRKRMCQATCTSDAQCETNHCETTQVGRAGKCTSATHPSSLDCQTPPSNALIVEKRVVSSEDISGGQTRVSYMITVKNISTTEDVENVQISDDIQKDQGTVTVIGDSLYGINLRDAQLNTNFNGDTNKSMLLANATQTGLKLKKYPSSESYASVIYAVTYPLGTKSTANLCDTASVTGTNKISRFVSTASNQKCIEIKATPTPTHSPTPTPTIPSNGTPTPTATPTPTPGKVDLRLAKTTDKTKIKVGDTVEFTITIANESALGALNVRVKDDLSDSFDYISHEATYGQYDRNDGIWSIGNLNALTTQTLKLKVRVVSKSDLHNLAEVYGVEQADIDSSPNNCDKGKNKEDDCADVTLTSDGEIVGATTKGGLLADTGNSLIAPLIFGVLGFGALFVVLKLHSKHNLVIRVSNPGAQTAAKELLSRLMVHQTIAGGVVVASALLVGVSILNVANTVQLAQLQRANRAVDQGLTLVTADVIPVDKKVSFNCGVATPLEISMTAAAPVRLTLVNTNTAAPAYIALPGYDVLTQSITINQPEAADDMIKKVEGETSVVFTPKTSGVWYITNASYCKKESKTNSYDIPEFTVAP